MLKNTTDVVRCIRVVSLVCVVSQALVTTVFASESASFEQSARPFLSQYCFNCHGEDEQSSKIRFDEFTRLTPDNAELWRLALESVEQGEMPPEYEEQPPAEERAAFVQWLRASLLAPELAGDPHQALIDPSSGNQVDHQKLFDGSQKDPAWSPPRMWRRSQSQYDALMEELWVLPKLRNDYATHKTQSGKVNNFAHYGYARPFPQMDPEYFTNYSGGVHADAATLRGLFDAGQQIAQRLTAEKNKHHGLHQPTYQIGHSRDNWHTFQPVAPPQRAAEFEPFVGEGAEPSPQQQSAAIRHVFELFHDRPPTARESERYAQFLATNIEKNGALAALRGLITAAITSPEFVFRMEVGMTRPDEHGRRMLAPRELMYAIAYALTDGGPDAALVEAAESGKLVTREDVEREVRRILADDSIEKLPKLRFWQEFFGYPHAMDVFKERDGRRYFPELLIRDADQLVNYVLDEDQQVFEQLLTIDRYFVGYPTAGGNDELRSAWIEAAKGRVLEKIEKARAKGQDISKVGQAQLVLDGKMIMPPARHNDAAGWSLQYSLIYGFDSSTMEWTDLQPMEIPEPRLGMLMHPAWLLAHSTNFDNDVVGRGHWIRERLLAGAIPDVPIGVEAQVPEDETKTLRQRMQVTRQEFCWKCHKRMDPLGLPFEEFDHFGWHRTVEYSDKRKRQKHPVDTTGAIQLSGESDLNGPVKDAREMVTRLAESERVRQSIIRHAFRFWMGRNEMLSDSPTLIAADKAYVDSDGSFNETLVSLLTSDSFLFRK